MDCYLCVYIVYTVSIPKYVYSRYFGWTPFVTEYNTIIIIISNLFLLMNFKLNIFLKHRAEIKLTIFNVANKITGEGCGDKI